MKTMNHTEYQRKLKRLPMGALIYIIADATEAVSAYPDSDNAGYYMDEISYAMMEMKRRKKPR
jgi:hypothetical protein